jgi:hypothetical protein
MTSLCSQSLKPKCNEKKVETGTLQELLYTFRQYGYLLGQHAQSILFPIKCHLFHNFIFLGSHHNINVMCKQLLKFKYPNKKT